MNKFIILANKTELDTFDDIDISINYQIDDILDISKRNTNFSKTITLPGTPKNNKFFKQIFDVNIDNVNFNPNIRIPATIRIGDNEILVGNMQLMNIKIDNKSITYDVTIAGSLKDIINSLDDYMLRDLDLSQYDHIRNSTNIQNSWEYKNVVNGSTVNFGEGGTGYVYPYIVNGNSQDIWSTAYIYDLFPAPYVKTVIDKLFEFAGFTYTSNFFNSEYFKKLILPYTGDKLQLPDEEVQARIVRAGVPSSLDYIDITPKQSRGSDWFYNDSVGYSLGGFTRESGTVDDNGSDLEFTDDSGQWTSDIFTCQNTGYYNIAFEGKLIPATTHTGTKTSVEFKEGEFEYRWLMYLVKTNGSTILLDSTIDPDDPNDIYGTQLFGLSAGSHPLNEGPNADTWYDIDTPLAFSPSADNVAMEVGDKIRIRLGFRYPNTVKWYGTSDNKHQVRLAIKQSLGGSFSKMVVEPATNDSLGNESVNMNEVLPNNFKMKDFLLDIIKMFNLVIQDNQNKENDLIIEPRDDFFKSKQKVKDWTYKLDNDSDVKITPMSELDAKTYLYTYTDDSDLYNKEYKDETNKTYGELSIDVINDFSTKVNKTKLSFAPTPSSFKFINNRVAPFFVEKDDEGFKPKKVKARILFYGGLLNSTTWKLKEYPDGPSTSLTKYPYAGMFDHPYEPLYDLGFGRTDKLYWDATVIPNNNLFEQFHKATLNNIIDINSRLLEARFHLTPKDIAEFDFRDIIFLNGSYWRVNKIKDYNPIGSDTLTKVVLYKLIDINILSPYSVEIPTSNSSCPIDIVAVVNNVKRPYYMSLSGQKISNDCCKQIGGFYNNGACFVGKRILPAVGVAPKPIGVNGGQGVVPIIETDGPQIYKKDSNALNTLGVKIYGRGNYVGNDIKSKVIIGDNNSISPNVKNSIVIGNGINATESGAIYLGSIKIGQDGTITNNGIVIIDGGKDTIFPFDKTNLIEIIDGSIDAVKNFGGDSNARPIIDGNTNNI